MNADLARTPAAEDRGGARAAIVVAALLIVGLAVQLTFLRKYPQPILFGDAAGYYSVGQRLQHAVAAAPRAPGATFESIRPYLYFAGVGTVYAAIDRLDPGDLGTFRTVLAVVNTVGMLGLFVLARALSGSRIAGIVALAAAVLYPSFSVQIGRLLPDPITGTLFVWSAALYAIGLRRARRRWFFASGLVLGAALLVRSQLLEIVLTLLLVVVGAVAIRARRSAETRRHAGALLLGLLPAAAAWTGIGVAVGGDLHAIEQLGNFTFAQRYPYGFWQFLDSDGWMGPYRLGTEPYYLALTDATRADPALLASRARQMAFTARYVAARWRESILLVFDNACRLYARPANDYKWDYPIPYRWQVPFHAALVILAVFGAALVGSDRVAGLGALFIPAALAVVHALSYPWPRFNQPAMPILLAFAGIAVVRAGRAPRRVQFHGLVCLIGAGLLVFSREAVLLSSVPVLARWLDFVAWTLLVGGLFVIARALVSTRRLVAAAALVLIALPAAHLWRDRRWHELVTPLTSTRGAEQHVSIDAEGCRRLRDASEAYLAFDLAPPVRPDVLDVTINGRSGPTLAPTMARFGESTSAGGRDRREYPQWWAVPLDRTAVSEAACTLQVVIRPRDGALVLGADHFDAQDSVYEGPSFGDWPYASTVKLEHDGDSRLPVQRPLSSRETRSFVRDEGRLRPVTYRHRIRIVTLQRNEGRLTWRTPRIPAGRASTLVFSAYSGERGRAELLVDGAPMISFDLGSRRDFDVTSGSYALHHRAQPPRGGMAYGVYALTVPSMKEARTVDLTIRFRSGMSIEPMFFSLDRRAPLPTAEALGLSGAALIPAIGLGDDARVDARLNNYPESTGRWGVAEVF